MADFDLTAFYGQFRDETWENLDLLEQGLTALEAQPGDDALLDRMLRAIHTTKGSAKILGFGQINRLAHDLEDVLAAVRKGDLSLTAEVGTVLLQVSEGIRTLTAARVEGRSPETDVESLLQALGEIIGEEEKEEPGPEAAPVVTVSAPSAGRRRETMRVDLRRVEHLGTLVSEILVLQQQAREQHRALQEMDATESEATRALASLKDRLEAYRHRFRPRQEEEVFHRLNWLENTVQRLRDQLHVHFRDQASLNERFSLTLDELQQESLAIRMMPIGSLFEIFPSVVRRMAADSGVEVGLEVRGVEVELDRRVLDLLRDPLIHLVRNALDHGIEPPQERERAKKPRRGNLILDAFQLGRRVEVRIQDDGQGIDLQRVRRTAVERGLLSEEQARETDEESLLDLLFQPGFTTRRQVTDISGRGVGLDVVRTAIRQLNGLVRVETEAGRGTTFILDVPLTLATTRALLVEAGEQVMAIPVAAIRYLTRVRPDEVIWIEGRPTLQWSEQTVPLLPLATTLGLPQELNSAGVTPAVIVGTDGRQVALAVDRLLDEAEMVVRPLGDILGTSTHFSAATISGTGGVIPILDLAGLLITRPAFSRAPERRPSAAAAPPESVSVLLVEDALTTREMERSILEAAGYVVETAFDGVDALEKLERGGVFHVVITDIEMPRMDGFELTDRIRGHERLAELPVVIVTAREDEQDRRRGLQVGAQAYIVKSRFDQSNLLEAIAQLVG